MTQNFKIVLTNVDKQTPNNVGFSDTITIKGDSKIALTSFNASFDINKTGQDILDQSFTMNLNETEYDDPRTVTIPDATYYNEVDLQIEMNKQLNRVFSAYEKDATDPRVFTGYGLNFSDNNTVARQTGIGGSVTKDKMIIGLQQTPLTTFPINLEDPFTINEDGEVTTETDFVDFKYDFNASGLTASSSATDPYLMSGGGVAFQYNMRFNLPNSYPVPLISYVKLSDQNGDSMSLYYVATRRQGEAAPTIQFFVEKIIGGISQGRDTISNDFYYWNTFINDNFQNPSAGPWSQSNAAKNDSYFLWCVRDGKWMIVYYDANTPVRYREVYTDGLPYKLSDNYTFSTSIGAASQNVVVVKPETIKGTFRATAPTTGSATLKTTFNFENASRLREIYSFGVVAQMQPENTLPAQYTPNGETDFYPKQNFELACEIDTIKIKNYVGTKGNTGSGRKNIIAYFTPSSTISQSSFIYSFDPSTPIYLTVDSKTDIDFNSMNIRFINTYSNKTFSADTITCVLTNTD